MHKKVQKTWVGQESGKLSLDEGISAGVFRGLLWLGLMAPILLLSLLFFIWYIIY